MTLFYARTPSRNLRRANARLSALWRQRWQVFREVLRGSVVLLVLLFPALIAQFDHHAAERIPVHAHATLGGEPVGWHVHSFEVPHQHGPQTEPAPRPIEASWSVGQLWESAPAPMTLAVGFSLLEGATPLPNMFPSDEQPLLAYSDTDRTPSGFLIDPPTLPPRI